MRAGARRVWKETAERRNGVVTLVVFGGTTEGMLRTAWQHNTLYIHERNGEKASYGTSSLRRKQSTSVGGSILLFGQSKGLLQVVFLDKGRRWRRIAIQHALYDDGWENV